MLDPICMHMYVPSLVRNFLYRRLAGTLSTLPKDLLMLGPAREMHCTAVLCRKLHWGRVNLGPQHLAAAPCLVALSGG